MRQLQLPVVGAENAPSLIAFLDQNNIDIMAAPADPEAAARAGDVDMVLVIPDDFGKSFTDGVPASVQLLTDDSNQSAGIATSRVRSLIQQYSSQIGNLRLLARGISPAVDLCRARRDGQRQPGNRGRGGRGAQPAAGGHDDGRFLWWLLPGRGHHGR